MSSNKDRPVLELILVRHGETEYNHRRLFCGWEDVDLNDRGIEDANRLKDKLQGEKIRDIYSSDLRRALHTAEIINQFHYLPIKPVKELREINFGRWQSLTYGDLEARYPDECTCWKEDWINFRPPEGESVTEFYDRVQRCLDTILAVHEQGTILLLTHGGFIRCLLAQIIGGSLESFWRFRIDPGSMTRLHFIDQYGVLTALNN